MQCARCQRFGHAAANCKMEFRCVKCAKNHSSGECPLGKDQVEDRSTLKCALCRTNGHPASYRGCPKVQELKNKFERGTPKTVAAKPVPRVPATAVTPAISYAQMASGRRPAQQTVPKAVTVPVIRQPEANTDLSSILLAIQAQMAQMQKCIAEQAERTARLEQQFLQQAARIDVIYSRLSGEQATTAPI